MKPEELFDTMSAIDDDILERSERNKISGASDSALAAGETAAGETAEARTDAQETAAGETIAKVTSVRETTAQDVDTGRKNTAKNTGRIIRIAAALAAVVAAIVAIVILGPKMLGGTGENGAGTPTPAVTIAAEGEHYGMTDDEILMARFLLEKASYPEKAELPDFNDYVRADGEVDYEGFAKAYNEWEEKAYANLANIKIADREQSRAGIAALVNTGLAQLLAGEEGTNRVCSPANLYVALAMLAETANGNSRSQILNLLGVENIEKLRGLSDVTWNLLYRNSGAMTRILANSLWLRDDDRISYVSATIHRLAETYHASTFCGTMGSSEYDQALQAWLNEQTGGLLKDFVANQSLDPNTALALATTIYFSAKWDDEFDGDKTEKQVFHAKSGDVERDFMHQTDDNGAYYTGDRFAAVIRRFEGGQFGDMIFFLPDEGVSAEELLSDPQVLSLINATAGTAQCTVLKINYAIPKFDVASDTDLSDSLKKLGVTDVFNEGTADFSSVAENSIGMYLSKVDHSVRVLIDEEGVKAAAYTVMPLAGALPPSEEEVDFVLDRPFVFAIRSETGIPLFVGVVELP